MGSTRTALVSCVQTILGFAKVARILSAHGEHLLPGVQGVCRPETSESTGGGGGGENPVSLKRVLSVRK